MCCIHCITISLYGRVFTGIQWRRVNNCRCSQCGVWKYKVSHFKLLFSLCRSFFCFGCFFSMELLSLFFIVVLLLRSCYICVFIIFLWQSLSFLIIVYRDCLAYFLKYNCVLDNIAIDVNTGNCTSMPSLWFIA